MHHVAGKGVGPRQEQAAEAEQAVESRGGPGAAADQVAEVDEAVAGLEPGNHRAVQPVQRGDLAMNGRNRPDPARGTENRKLLPIAHDLGVDSFRSGVGYRSEEHTSELQSLMRISYAVFCLKKKKIR